ncbi:MAG TPA: MdtA/MuxA family multidrug efflux RND transporter periplasmic adaptor subunit [Aliidongia sp.]|nr:MdtA/MuxA family multidrug efflux RND transporter periplasmic adaptor subunit [Aliidongia sp.]
MGRAPERMMRAPVPQRRRSRLRWAIAILLIAALIGGAVWEFRPASKPAAGRGGRFAANGPMPVVGAVATKGDMPVLLNELGTVMPLATVTVKTQIAGQLIQVAFQEGQLVKEGDFLAQIDPRPYQAALEQAQGQLARDQAQLANAHIDLNRYKKLFAQDSVAQQTLDTQAALVQQLDGTVKTDQGQVDTAKINLAYCHIVSPVTGRVGLRQVDQGNYVQTSDANGLVVITQLQPIDVLFTLPEDNLPDLMKRMHAGATLPVVAFDRSLTRKLATGAVATLDNQIDTSTGTVKIKALFANQDESLFPNQFVNAQLQLDVLHDAVLIPVSAIQRGAPGTFVYVIKSDNTVAVQPVTTGPSDSTNIAITKGLDVGTKVVIDGADKLKDGSQVTLPQEKAADQQAEPPDARQQRQGGDHPHRRGAQPE